MDPKKLDQQLDELWKRVQGTGKARALAEPSLNLFSEERALVEESLLQGRRRFAQEKARWQALLEERDRALAFLSQEKRRLEAEMARLSQELSELRASDQARLELESLKEAERESEAARRQRRHETELALYAEQVKSLEAARKEEAERHEAALQRWQKEEKAWSALLEKRDKKIADLEARLNEFQLARKKDEALWEEEKRRLEQTLKTEMQSFQRERDTFKNTRDTREAEVRNFQKLAEKSQQEAADAVRAREEAEIRLKASEERAGRLERDLQTLREEWESERARWRDLWDKERSSRETWQADMRDWEERLRREREQWLAQFQAEQAAREQASRKVEQTVDRLRQAVWTFPVFSGQPRPARGEARASGWSAGAPAPSVLAPDGGALPRRARRTLGVFAALFAAAALSFLFPVFSGPQEYPAPAANASALTARGENLWYSEWMGGQLFQAAAQRPDRILFFGSNGLDFHPVALRWAQDRLWALDPWSRTLQEHRADPPFSVLKASPLPPDLDPVDMAWDGQGFWILDRRDQSLRRYPLGDFQAADRQAVLPSGWRLTALDFYDGEFWGYDEAARRLRRFTASPEVLPRAEYRLPAHEKPASSLTGLSVTDREVWTMSEKSLTVYRWPRWRMALRGFFD